MGKPFDIVASLNEEIKKSETFWKAMGGDKGYINKDCPECGRHRVIHWGCGKDICEKCNWCIQDNEFYNWDYHEYIGEI